MHAAGKRTLRCLTIQAQLDIPASIVQNTCFIHEESYLNELRQPLRGARVKISALGTYVPPRLITNADLEKMVDTSNDWIMTRVGIR
jgi:hypothetical protein